MNTLTDNSIIKGIAVLVLMCFFQLQSAISQTVDLNQEGEKIVIYGDGSWRFLDESDPDDMALYKSSDIYQQTIDEVPKQKKSKAAKAKSTAKAKTKKVKTKKGKSKKSASPKSKNKTKVAKAPKSKKNKGAKKSAPSIGSRGSQNYKQMIRKKIIAIRDQQSIAFEKERVANYATDKYDRELKLAKKRKLSKGEIAKVESSYKAAKSQLKDARDQNKILLKQRKAYESIQKKSGDALVKSYANLEKKYDNNFKIDPPKNRESLAIKEKKKSRGKKNKSDDYTSASSDYDTGSGWEDNTGPSAYTVAYPKKKPNANEAAVAGCAIAFKGEDSFSGKKRTDLEASPFFSFTSDKMRPYFADGDMVQCEAYLSAVAGGYRFVCIEVTVASETAQKSYGSIDKQGLLSLKMVDGTTVNMYNNKSDSGSLDPLKKTVLYKAQYLIPNEHVKTLSKTDIDRVRLVWSTGYEDYTIYETDFLINQLNCLDK